jgi:type IX secretion system PorP/SprF family membrane protein
MYKVLVKFLVAFFVVLQIRAQQIPVISNFMYNRMVYNPAAAGSLKSQFNANMISRLQWSDIAGAPTNFMFWSDYRFNAYKMAVGVNVAQERLGGYSNTDFMANYSYYIQLNKSLKLGMGIKAGFTNAVFSPGNISKVRDKGDLSFDNSAYSTVVPKIGTGFQLYNSDFYLSISMPDLYIGLPQSITDKNENTFLNKKRNIVVMAGYHLKLGDQYAIYPNIFTTYHASTGFRADANMLFEITDYFWFGGTYSTSNNHNFIIGTNLSARIKFAYSYGIKTGTSTDVTLNTHELNLMLTLDNLFKKKKS